MPMMFGFSNQRREMLAAEARRISEVAAQLGAFRVILIGNLPEDRVGPASELELVIVQDTEEPFHRRADFWVGHVRPCVGTRFLVYTAAEFEALQQDDPILVRAQTVGEVLV